MKHYIPKATDGWCRVRNSQEGLDWRMSMHYHPSQRTVFCAHHPCRVLVHRQWWATCSQRHRQRHQKHPEASPHAWTAPSPKQRVPLSSSRVSAISTTPMPIRYTSQNILPITTLTLETRVLYANGRMVIGYAGVVFGCTGNTRGGCTRTAHDVTLATLFRLCHTTASSETL